MHVLYAGAMHATKTLLVVYHSHTCGTRQMVEAAVAGALAADSGVAVRLLPAPEAQAADVLAAEGYLFATPENLAAVSGLLKDFLTAPTTAHSTGSTAAPMPAWSAPAATAPTPPARSHALPPAGACGLWQTR